MSSPSSAFTIFTTRSAERVNWEENVEGEYVNIAQINDDRPIELRLLSTKKYKALNDTLRAELPRSKEEELSISLLDLWRLNNRALCGKRLTSEDAVIPALEQSLETLLRQQNQYYEREDEDPIPYAAMLQPSIHKLLGITYLNLASAYKHTR